jgi:hypothetical protein
MFNPSPPAIDATLQSVGLLGAVILSELAAKYVLIR